MQALLTIAEGTPVTNPGAGDPLVPLGTLVKRSLLAPGPDFARDCAMLAVYWDGITAEPVSQWEALGGPCIVVPSVRIVLVYADDCVPAQTDGGSPPTPAAIEAYTVQWTDRVTALWQATVQAALDGGLSAGGCCEATVDDASPGRPSPFGKMAQAQIPVRLRLQA